jgi:hypothetical protein
MIFHHDLNKLIQIRWYNFHFYSPQAIGVWSLSSGERPKEKIQIILLILSKNKIR